MRILFCLYAYTLCVYTGGKMNTQDALIRLRNSTGMTRKEFCEYFGIPYRTLQDWELGNRTMPDYLLRLMIYRVKIEQLYNQNQDSPSDSDQ